MVAATASDFPGREQTKLCDISLRLGKCIERISNLTENVDMHAVALGGASPPTDTGSTVKEVRSDGLVGTVGDLEDSISVLESALRRFD